MFSCISNSPLPLNMSSRWLILFIHLNDILNNSLAEVLFSNLKLDRFLGRCPGYENLPVYIDRPHIIIYKSDFVVSGTLIVKRDILPDLKLVLQLDRCRAKEDLDSCEPYTNVTKNNVCVLSNSLPAWLRFAKQVQPEIPCPTKKSFLDEVLSLTEEKVRKWWELITNMMGTNCDSKFEWNKIFKLHISELYDEMISEAVAKRDTLLTKIEEHLKKASFLCKTLSIKMPNYGSQCLTLYEEQEYLVQRIKELFDFPSLVFVVSSFGIDNNLMVLPDCYHMHQVLHLGVVSVSLLTALEIQSSNVLSKIPGSDKSPAASRRRKLENLTQAMQQLWELSQNIQDSSNNEDEAFGNFVAATLSNLGKADALMAQHEIQGVLVKYRYEDKIKSIQNDIQKLNEEERSLCCCLGQPTKPLSLELLPSKEEIIKFKNYLDELESKKFEREEEFLNIKPQILELVEELKYKPCLDFERMVVSPDDSIFVVSADNMASLSNFMKSLKQLSEEVKDKISYLREKLESLWDLLNENLHERDSFLKKQTGNNMMTLKALQVEVKRCEDIKKANIEVFVNRLRQDLTYLWDKCHVSQEGRNDFDFFYSDAYSEDLLSIHDMEIAKLKSFYNDNSDIFNLLNKRTELWNRMRELEELVAMPERFKNRGGQLLKEEKERNAIAKRLPKIEEQLVHLANAFQIKHGKPFYSWGKTIHSIVEESHIAFEEERKIKLSARKQKRDQTITPLRATPSTSTQNLVLITPKAGLKRKLAPSASVTSSKLKVLCESNGKVPRTAPPKIVLSGKTIVRSRCSIEKARRKEKLRRVSRRLLQKQRGKENSSSEYDMFENDIHNKEDCRSTVFSGHEDVKPLAVRLPVTPKTKRLDLKHRSDSPDSARKSEYF
ncbi:hypothetical protein FQA39_LY08451 [Lamprigera yunnana]|nr:hypothetical protein FQA39_LY08451 [Lamprigera yunnana]